MKLTVTGSSSRGNGYVLHNEREALLLEAGVRLDAAKRALGYNIAKVAGCLVTHEHGDHAGHINEVLDAAIPVYASAGTIANVQVTGNRKPRICAAGELLTLGGFRVLPFATQHDAAEPLGFYINHPEIGNLLFATDTYFLANTFEGLTNIMIECNYRLDLLNTNTLPQVVRDRTLKSHLSLDHCIRTLQANDLTRVNNIVLIHLSDGNSNAAEFKAGVQAATGKMVYVAEAGLEIEVNKTPF